MRPEPGDVARAIEALDEAFARDIQAGDAAALARDFYAHGAVLLPPNHPLVAGRTAIRDYWQALLDAGLESVTLRTARTTASGGIAYGIGSYRLMLARVGGERTQDVGKFLVVYQRQRDGCWKAAADMFSSDQEGL